MKRFLYALTCLSLCFNLILSAAAIGEFVDVKEDDWYAEAVEYTCGIGLFRGMGDNKFEPNIPITRGMFVTVLGRFTGIADDPTAHADFDDVPDGQYYTGYVRWAQDANIVNGIAPRLFAPDAHISRQDMCVMLRRYCNYMGVELTECEDKRVFDDEDAIADYAREAVHALQLAGIVNGMGDCFVPQGTSTRAQAATVFMRLAKLAQSQEGSMRLTDRASGVTVDYTIGSGISAATALTVRVDTDTDTLTALSRSLHSAKTYELAFSENDSPIAVNSITVKIPIAEGDSDRAGQIWAITGENQLSAVQFKIENGYYVFNGNADTTYVMGVSAWTKNY